MSNVRINMSGFNIIKASLKDNFKTRVGILGSEASQEIDGELTMAGLGAVHEFGSISMNIPRRSFIREPLEDNIMDWIKDNSSEYYDQMKKGSVKKWYVALGYGAEAIISEGFSTRGS